MGEAAEELGHGEVGFTVSIVAGRVEKDGGVVGEAGGVASPEVAVEERVFRIGGEELVEIVEKKVGLGEGFTTFGEALEQRGEPLVAPELEPGGAGFVVLRGSADGVVEGEAGFGSGVLMKLGELVAECYVSLGSERLEGEVFEDVVGMGFAGSVGKRLRDADGVGFGESFEGEGFGLEHEEGGRVVGFDEMIARAEGLADVATGDGLVIGEIDLVGVADVGEGGGVHRWNLQENGNEVEDGEL